MKVFLRLKIMEKKFSKIKENIADKLDMPREVLLDIPKITIVGNDEITIENHKGIIIFKENYIKIKSKIGIINIEGMNFEILFISGYTIVLSGLIKFIDYEGK